MTTGLERILAKRERFFRDLVRWRGEDYSFYTTLRFEMLPVAVQAQAGLTNAFTSLFCCQPKDFRRGNAEMVTRYFVSRT